MAKSNSFFRSWFASGEPWIWMNAAAVGLSISAVVGILLLIAVKGLAHFWPSDVDLITYTTETAQVQQVYGEFVELDQVSVEQFLESGGNPEWVQPNAEIMDRWLVKTG
ncbi:phosphate ABC transporter, permease protein PstA, partial [Pseudomonadales bacterium]|nr:phosphate ABC transporter, permease protein PstA [Pseudomonadales bacterium]